MTPPSSSSVLHAQTQEALEDSRHGVEGLGPGGEGGPAAAGPLGGHDGSTDHPDSATSWRTHEGPSERSLDEEDVLGALLLRAEDRCSHVGHSRARRRESVNGAKENQRESAGPHPPRPPSSSCCRSKSPEIKSTDLSRQWQQQPAPCGLRECSTAPTQKHLGLRPGSVSQSPCTVTQSQLRGTEVGGSHGHSPHCTDNDSGTEEVNAAPSDLDAEPPWPSQCRESTHRTTTEYAGRPGTCTIQISDTEDGVRESLQRAGLPPHESTDIETQDLCKQKDVEQGSVEPVRSNHVDYFTDPHIGNSECADSQYKQEGGIDCVVAIHERSADINTIEVFEQHDLRESIGTENVTNHEREGHCTGNLTDEHITGLLKSTGAHGCHHTLDETKHKSWSGTTTTTTEVIKAQQGTTETPAPQNTNTGIEDTPSHIVSSSDNLDGCLFRRTDERPCVLLDTPPELSLCKDSTDSCVDPVTEVKRSSGTVNEIGSSITFSAEAEALFSFASCAPDLTRSVLQVLQQAVPGSSPPGHDTRQRREKRPGRRRRRTRGSKAQPWQDSGQTQRSIPQSSELEATGRDKPDSLDPLEKVQECSALPEPGSAQTLPDRGVADGEVLPPLIDKLLVSLDSDSCHRQLESSVGEGRKARSPCCLSLKHNGDEVEEENTETAGSYVCFDILPPENPSLSDTDTADVCESICVEVNSRECVSLDAHSTVCLLSEGEESPAEPLVLKSYPCIEQPGLGRGPVPLSNIEIICSLNELSIKHPESPNSPITPWNESASLSAVSDSNNNTKASRAGGAEETESTVWSSNRAQSSSNTAEKTACNTLEASTTTLTSDLSEYAKKAQEVSDVFPSPVCCDHYWSSEDSAVSGLGDFSPFSLTQVEDLEEEHKNEEKRLDYASNQIDCGCRNVEEHLGSVTQSGKDLAPLVPKLDIGWLLDKDCNEELNNCSRRPPDYKESFEDYFLAEEYREPQEGSSRGAQQGVNIFKEPYPDISLNLPPIRSLEPILEADRGQDSSVVSEDDSQVKAHKVEDMGPVEDESASSGNLTTPSPKSSCCQHELEEDTSTPTEMMAQFHTPVAEVNDLTASPLLRHGGEKRCRPITMSCDTTPCSANSGNNEEDKTSKKGKTKGSQTANKASKFSVFAKMPSFRKAKNVKGSKAEEPSRESTERGEESVPSESEPSVHEDNSDDEVFVKESDILNQAVQQAFSSRRDEEEEESYGFFPPTPRTRHVQQLLGHRGPGEANGALDPDGLHQTAYKRSKSNDSLNNNIRMRFAQAHKSLSSLFESRSMDKENEEHLSSANEGDLSRAKQSWRRLKRAKEAELLRRALSVPEGDTGRTGTGEDLEDSIISSVQDGMSISGSPASLRALRHTDPLSKRGFPQGDGTDIPHGCKSEGQRRKCSGNGLPITAPSSSDDSEALPINEPQSPISPSSLASLYHPHSPTGVPLPPLTGDVLIEGPLRPMSPKPNSPRPAAQRRVFRYPHSVRASVLSSVRLCQSVSVEGLTDPPERPKTLKPTASPLGLSLSPLEGPESSIDNQSHTSLHTIGSIHELEVRKMYSPFNANSEQICN